MLLRSSTLHIILFSTCASKLCVINSLPRSPFHCASTQPAAPNCDLSSLTVLKGMRNVEYLIVEIVLGLLERRLMGRNAFRWKAHGWKSYLTSDCCLTVNLYLWIFTRRTYHTHRTDCYPTCSPGMEMEQKKAPNRSQLHCRHLWLWLMSETKYFSFWHRCMTINICHHRRCLIVNVS